MVRIGSPLQTTRFMYAYTYIHAAGKWDISSRHWRSGGRSRHSHCGLGLRGGRQVLEGEAISRLSVAITIWVNVACKWHPLTSTLVSCRLPTAGTVIGYVRGRDRPQFSMWSLVVTLIAIMHGCVLSCLQGEEGYFRIKRGNNECGIEGQVTASANDAVWSKKN